MIEIKINEIVRDFYDWRKESVYKTHTLIGNTLEEIFPKVYAFERSSRYDNARRYEITDPGIHKEYQNWKRTGITIQMYYGNATVD